MRTKLAIIALSSFAVSALCLGGAFALGGNAIGDAVFNFDGFGLPRCDLSGNEGGPTTRTLPWNGEGDTVSIAIPANTRYQAGSGDQLVVSGDPSVIAHVRVRNGTVDMDCRDGFHFGHGNRVEVTLPGRRSFRNFEMLGTGDMQLTSLAQPEAKVELDGSGTVKSEGKVDRLRLEINGSGTVQSKGQSDNLQVEVNGSGRVQLADLVAKDAHVEISGSGKVDVAPQNSLNVDISGSGTIYLHSEPKSLETDISGSGHIVHANGDVEDRHDRHAALESRHGHHLRYAAGDDGGIGQIVQDAIDNGRDPDPDALKAAEAKLQQRIRAQVAEAIANAPIGDDR